jgi:hypothetical protein
LAIALAIASVFGVYALIERRNLKAANAKLETQRDDANRARDRAQRAEQQADRSNKLALQMSQQKHDADLRLARVQASEAEARVAAAKHEAVAADVRAQDLAAILESKQRALKDEAAISEANARASKAESERDEARRQRDGAAQGQVQDASLRSLNKVGADSSQSDPEKILVPSAEGKRTTTPPSVEKVGGTEDLSTVKPAGASHNRPQDLIPSCETQTTLASSKYQSKRGDDQYQRAVSVEEGGDAFSALGLYAGAYCDYLSVLDSRSGGEAPDPAMAANFLQAGYFYVWYLLDFHQDDEGERALAKMSQVANRYGPQNASPPLLRAMAALENLKSRRAAELKKPNIEYLRNAIRFASRALAQDESLETMRFLFRLYENYADSATPKNEQADFKNKACELADQMFQKNPEYKYSVRARVECLRYQSDAIARKEPDIAGKKLDAAHDVVENALRSQPKDQDLLMLAAAIQVDEADLVFQKKDGTAATQNEHKLSAEKYFAKAFSQPRAPRKFSRRGQVPLSGFQVGHIWSEEERGGVRFLQRYRRCGRRKCKAVSTS